MSGKPRRRVRVRRKRREPDWVDGEDVADAAESFGCCLFEVVISAAAVTALVAVPVGMLVG